MVTHQVGSVRIESYSPREAFAIFLGGGFWHGATAHVRGDDAECLADLAQAGDSRRLWAWLSANDDHFAAALRQCRRGEAAA
jgi:hypothetical protein